MQSEPVEPVKEEKASFLKTAQEKAEEEELELRNSRTIHWACRTGDILTFRQQLKNNSNRVKALLVENDGGIYGDQPLHIASRYGHVVVVEELLQAGAPIDETNDNGNTPLIVACSENQVNVVRFLLANGANITIKGSQGKTCLHRSCQLPNGMVAEAILATSQVNEELVEERDEQGNSAVHLASESGLCRIVSALLDISAGSVMSGNVMAWTPLHLASYRGHRDVCQLLLERGANPVSLGSDSRTCLHQAIINDHAETCRLLLKRRPDLIYLRDEVLGASPIHYAAQYGAVKSIPVLMDFNADMNDYTLVNSYSVMQLAAMAKGIDDKIVEVLHDWQAALEYRGPIGRCPLHIAAQ